MQVDCRHRIALYRKRDQHISRDATRMAPSAKQVEEALVDGTYHIFTAEPDATTVNKVRKHVEDELGVEEGFLASDEWKQKSKTLIKECVVSDCRS